MNPTLSYLLGRKMWLVRGINVWGEIANFGVELLYTETDSGTKRLLFGSHALGGSVQQLEFKDLIDIRGNNLPESIINPKVVIVPKNEIGVVVSGNETERSFMLAKMTQVDRNGIVDLLIVELG